MRFRFKINETMRERMKAGLSFVYTTRDGLRWYIDATLPLSHRQIDFAEAMYDAFSLDGRGFYPSYPSLSVCQYALEERCPEWHGVGWYWLHFEDEDSNAEWVDEIDVLKDKVAKLEEGWKKEGRGFLANWAGDGSIPVIIY